MKFFQSAVSFSALFLVTLCASAQGAPNAVSGGGITLPVSGLVYATPTTYGTATPAQVKSALTQNANINLIFAGDSRLITDYLSGSATFPYQVLHQPNFAGMTLYDTAVDGSMCANLAATYAGSVYPHRPMGSVQTSYLVVETGINDVINGASAPTVESCLSSYLATAVADGFTPVLFTEFYTAALSDTQEIQRKYLNKWLLEQSPLVFLVFDTDAFFPPVLDYTQDPEHWDQTHLSGPIGTGKEAAAFNNAWGLGKSGSTSSPVPDRELVVPLHGVQRTIGALKADYLVAGPAVSQNASVGDVTGTHIFFNTVGGDPSAYIGLAGSTIRIQNGQGGGLTFAGGGPISFGGYLSASSVAVTPTTPASGSVACTANTMWHDDSYFYACNAAGTAIKRAALSSF